MNNDGKQDPTDGQGISLRELWQVFWRRKWIVAGTALTVLAFVTVASFLTVPVYTAMGQILIEREPNILSFENMFQIEPLSDDYYQTQYKLLQSRALVGTTIDRIKLTENARVVHDVLGGGDFAGRDTKNDPMVRRSLISWFMEQLAIQPVRKTRLVEIRFSNRDPRLAADALNALIESYVEMNVERRYQATEEATGFLAGQIETVRNDIQAKEQKLQDYGRSKNIIALNSNENTVVESLGELNRALTDAQIDRINKETYYNEIKNAGPDYIPIALNNSLVQRLAEEYNRLSRDFAKSSETFLPDYPQVQSLKAELDTAKQALETETKAQVSRAYTDLQAALSKEQALSQAFNRQRGAAFQLNNNAIQYNSLLIEIQNAKNLLESLMTRKSEADVSSRLKGSRTSNIWVVDRAEIPMAPSSPDKKKNMALGLMIGLFLGLGLALLLESLDVTVKDAADVRKYAGVPTLGIIPMFPKDGSDLPDGPGGEDRPGLSDMASTLWASIGQKRGEHGKGRNASKDLLIQFMPDSVFAEQYRSIRTSLLYFMEESERRAIAVTSPMPQDGKTATACNLAASLAHAGKRVVIIDADLRKPRVHKIFQISNLNGLAKFLTGDLPGTDLLRTTPLPTLFVINAGSLPSEPLELLGSEKLTTLVLQLKKDFDFVVVDTPPALAVSDALVIGSQLDAAIMIVRRGKTPREALKRAQEKLEAHKIRNIGVVINAVRWRDLDEYQVSSYYGHRRRTDG